MAQANITFEKKDIYRNFVISVPAITGMNQTVAPNRIEDTECQEIWNFLPLGRGILRKINSAKLIAQTNYPVVYAVSGVLNGNYNLLIVLNNGAVYKWDGSSLAEIAPSGTLSGEASNLSACVWQNSKIYFIDVSKGYFKWDGSTWTHVSPDVTGHHVTVWQGRVFYARGSLLNYSSALNPEDFVGDGSGYVDIAASFPDLKVKIMSIVPYVDSLIIYGDSATMALTGSTISNDPSNWYLTEVSNAVGVKLKNSLFVYQNQIFFASQNGLYRGTLSQSEKYDYKIDLFKNVLVDGQSCVTQVNNLLTYFIPCENSSPFRGLSRNIVCFNIDMQEFFLIDIGINANGIYRSYIPNLEDRIYVLADDGLYALFEGNSQIGCYLKTKSFDFDKLYLKKFWWVFSVIGRFYSSDVNIDILADTDISHVQRTTTSRTSRDTFVFSNSSNAYFFTDGTNLVSFYPIGIGKMMILPNLVKSSGIYADFTVKETSEFIWDFLGFEIKGQLAREVM